MHLPNTTLGAGALVGLAIGALVIASCTPSGTGTQTASADPIARGDYLVQFGGCGDCHTPGTLFGGPDRERLLAGSELGWRGPWGVTYASNLTPDPETGIGTWSEDDIVTALRTGIRPDGSPLLPPMPWPNYTVMTDEDAYAIAAYLKSLPPISHAVPEHVSAEAAAAVVGSILTFPAPSAWDAPRGAEAAAP